MKWSGGPVVARAIVSGLRQMESCTPNQLLAAVTDSALHGLQRYWSSLPPRFEALAIYLADETWLDDPLTVAGRSRGSSWIVLANRDERERWMTTLPPMARAKDPRGQRTAGLALRFAVFRRDSYSCQYCGRRAPEFPLHVDHIIPWSRGGRTELANLRTACNECNLGKSDTEA